MCVIGCAVRGVRAKLQLPRPHPGGRRRWISLPLLLPTLPSSLLAWQRWQWMDLAPPGLGRRGWCRPRWLVAVLVWGYGCTVFEAGFEALWAWASPGGGALAPDSV
jgi:hypothetical protein